jgi:hypothetical protein
LVYVQFEDAAREAADEITQPRPPGEEMMEDIQVLLKSGDNPVQIRDLRVSTDQRRFSDPDQRSQGKCRSEISG